MPVIAITWLLKTNANNAITMIIKIKTSKKYFIGYPTIIAGCLAVVKRSRWFFYT
ncbi:hypothetical protein FDG95_gp537 [Pectobacterium phage vB_PcaM_CBB]|uniref:Putative membrane protein n=1 Tax=Pectobacterium phage vB_PcaM_CBB TaxID=2772511 RepID=A0A1L2CVE9_9CAUD|nr:hypothetical protein FDG95_gp537 [Pectobacterium phage vB_PcaM_CBB]AMM44005.1 putative membrane protein [Pectobacterium phage vB_PcaM_CBB]